MSACLLVFLWIHEVVSLFLMVLVVADAGGDGGCGSGYDADGGDSAAAAAAVMDVSDNNVSRSTSFVKSHLEI